MWKGTRGMRLCCEPGFTWGPGAGHCQPGTHSSFTHSPMGPASSMAELLGGDGQCRPGDWSNISEIPCWYGGPEPNCLCELGLLSWPGGVHPTYVVHSKCVCVCLFIPPSLHPSIYPSIPTHSIYQADSFPPCLLNPTQPLYLSVCHCIQADAKDKNQHLGFSAAENVRS